MNTVSTVSRSLRFMSAIWNSYSKSEIARRPRTMQSACSRWTRSMSRPSNDVIRIRPTPMLAVHSSISSRRSLTVKRGTFEGFATTATMSSSKIRRLRSMRSRCPLCIGSNVPGYTARLPTEASTHRRSVEKTSLSLRGRSKESQGGLAEFPRLPDREDAGSGGRRRLAGVLDDDHGARQQAAALRHPLERRRASGRRVGRIEEHHGETLSAPGQSRDGARRVVANDACSNPEPETLHVVAQCAHRRGVLLDEDGRRRSPGNPLDANAAGPREEIEKRTRGKIRHQGVETGDA